MLRPRTPRHEPDGASAGLRIGLLRRGVATRLALSAVLAGCAASSSNAVLRGAGTDFAVGPTPSSWRRVDVSDAVAAYRDDTLDATAAVNARCGKDADDVPLEALRRHLFIYFTDREIQEEGTLMLDGREALRTVMSAKLDGVDRAFVVYVLKKDGCVYDFMYISEPGTASRGLPAFERFVMGFRTLSR